MPLEADHSHLPKPSNEGWAPDRSPRFGPTLAYSWVELYSQRDDDNSKIAVDTARIRHSWAANCGRRIGYELTLTEDERSDPMTVADFWRLGIGKAVHEWLQSALLVRFPDATMEEIVQLLDGVTAGRGDITLLHEGKRVAIELKTINGFGFKKSVGARGAPEGPRWSAVVQGSLNAIGTEADELVIIYLALELLSPREAKKINADQVGRFCAEWTIDKDTFTKIAMDELERFNLILADVDAGILPERIIPDPELPDGATITNPSTGEWRVEGAGLILDTGSTWHCNYCPFQRRCTEDMEKGL